MKPGFVLACLIGLMAPYAHGAWGDGRPWNDRRAEVAIYDSERVLDGKPRQFREEILVKKENVSLDSLTAVEKKRGIKTIPVLTMTVVQNVESNNYPHRSVTTVMLPTESIHQVLKMTMGYQEWNGNTYKELVSTNPVSARFSWHSYRDDMGSGEAMLSLLPDDYFEDQLILSLRALPFSSGLNKDVRLWESLTSNNQMISGVSSATIQVQEEEVIRGRAGSLPCWRVAVTKDNQVDYYWFEKAEPHILVKMEAADGRKRMLYGRARWPYWDQRIPRPNIIK